MRASRTRCAVDGLAPVYVKADDVGADFLEYFKNNFRVHIVSESEDGLEIVFDMVGVDAPIANALRRILLSEVPTIAIETVYVYQNTSLLPDEVLAHRLGLVPLNADPRLMRTMAEEGDLTEMSALVFELNVEGTRIAMTAAEAAQLEGSDDFEGRYTKVYSSALEWKPQGEQQTTLGEAIGPVHGDILLAKLAPGQCIKLEAHAVKSNGKDHAKFSPVATASYRLLPTITLDEKRPFVDAEADALVSRCPRNVFDIEEIGTAPSAAAGKSRGRTASSSGGNLAGGSSGGISSVAASNAHRKAVVARPRDCTICRECIRPPEWSDRVRIERINDHYIFSIESTGALKARDLLKEALRVLSDKANALMSDLDRALASDSGGVMSAADTNRASIAAMRTGADELT